jgi:hypothetical protein
MQVFEGDPVSVTPGPVTVVRIGSPPLLRVPGDFNADGAASVQDIFDFLSAYGGGYGRADRDGDGRVDVGDVFHFLR